MSPLPYWAVINLAVPSSMNSAREEPLRDPLDHNRVVAADRLTRATPHVKSSRRTIPSASTSSKLETVLVPFGATAFPCALTILFSEMLHVCSPIGQGRTRDPERLPQ